MSEPSEQELTEALGRPVYVERMPTYRGWIIGTHVRVGVLSDSVWCCVDEDDMASTANIVRALQLGVAGTIADLESKALGEDDDARDARLDRALDALRA